MESLPLDISGEHPTSVKVSTVCVGKIYICMNLGSKERRIWNILDK